MAEFESTGKVGGSVDFWDAWVEHFDDLEHNHMVPELLARFRSKLRSPVLVIGGGLGLLVDDLRRHGMKTDGVDWSSTVVRLALQRRNIDLTQADARDLPFDSGAYASTIIATGVADFMDDDNATRAVKEALRVTSPDGTVMVGFYQMSAAMVRFLTELGLLHNGVLRRREVIAMGRMSSRQMMAKLRQSHNGSILRAAGAVLRMSFGISRDERRMRSVLHRIFVNSADVDKLISAVEERVPYRDLVSVSDFVRSCGAEQSSVHDYGTCWIADLKSNQLLSREVQV